MIVLLLLLIACTRPDVPSLPDLNAKTIQYEETIEAAKKLQDELLYDKNNNQTNVN